MERCHSCHAPYTAVVPTCEYCGALTPEGMRKQRAAEQQQAEEQQAAERAAERREREARRAREEEEAQQALHLRAARSAELRTSVSRGFTSSVIGVLLCGVPLGSFVSLFYLHRARKLAVELGEKLPGRVWPSLLLNGVGLWAGGIIWLVLTPLLWKQSAREDALRNRLVDARMEPALSREAACDLLELYLLKENDGYKYSIESTLRCDSAMVEQVGPNAMLRGASILTSTKDGTVFACLAYMYSSWRVQEVRDEAGCTASPASADAAQP